MYIPYFHYGCTLEINTQRTASYIQNLSDIVPLGTLNATVDLDCDCDPLRYVLDSNDVPQVATYVTPAADLADWFDADIPESGRFLGFMVEDFVMSSVAGRSLATRLSSSGGGTLGPVRHKERRMEFTVLMFAADETAMEYGFRYLTDALASPGCDDGSILCDAEFRDSCHTIQGGPQLTDSFNEGRWILKNVGLVEGPNWGDAPVEGAACHVRRVRFTLASELPWKFKCPVTECSDVALAGYPSEGTDCDNWDEILCGKQEVACSVNEALILGETGLIVEIDAGDLALQHIQIAIRPDQYGYEAAPLTRPVGYTRIEPCDMIYIPELPAGYTLVYDTAVESMYVRTPGGGTFDATPLIATSEGSAPTFPTLRCGNFAVSVAASECSVTANSTVTIRSVHREI